MHSSDYINEINEALVYIFNNIFVKGESVGEVDYERLVKKCDTILYDLDRVDYHGNTKVLKDYVASIRQLIHTEQCYDALPDLVYALSELVYISRNHRRHIHV